VLEKILKRGLSKAEDTMHLLDEPTQELNTAENYGLKIMQALNASDTLGCLGRPVEIQAYAGRIVIRQEGSIVGEHRRRFGRGETL
jgi:hypothetical protein